MRLYNAPNLKYLIDDSCFSSNAAAMYENGSVLVRAMTDRGSRRSQPANSVSDIGVDELRWKMKMMLDSLGMKRSWQSIE